MSFLYQTTEKALIHNLVVGQAMVPIKTISNPSTQIILSGDPLQLGPIIRSGVARALGLGVSFLERLMRRDIYNERIWHGITYVAPVPPVFLNRRL